jgi:hypothetical protein
MACCGHRCQPQGIDSVARALRMDPSERAHLFGIF